ncbi:hypothetical protein [Rugosimonospora acidiphila]|uniref:hypothetical protein n=1 Tax=Rugosimonospora acidiphila TaxID=556531 RepID=UPI0031E5119B
MPLFARRGTDLPVGSDILVSHLGTWAPLVIGFLAQTYAGMVIEKTTGKFGARLQRWYRRRGQRRRLRRAVALMCRQEPPSFTDADIQLIRLKAFEAAGLLGYPEPDQRRFADAIASALASGPDVATGQTPTPP